MSFHSNMADEDVHALTAKTYADETARDADTAWQITANINKLVKITDIDAYQVLVSVGATVWLTVAGGNLGDILADDITADAFNLTALQAAPSAANDTGVLGEVRWTTTHVYLCTATNTWVRVAIATW